MSGGVTTPRGFRASGVACGIKKSGLDLAVLAADTAVPAAAVFTTNKAQAAPILISQRHMARSRGRIRAVVVNSGCANACTGEQGMTDAVEMATLTAAALKCEPHEVLVASTGVIGVNLPMERVRVGIADAVRALSSDGGNLATRAIMTTDPFPKSCAASTTTSAGKLVVGGMTKGSGMIAPNMATMLGFLTTDAEATPERLDAALRQVVDDSFNAITVDGDCSTNDCVFLMASGASGVKIDAGNDAAFRAVLQDVAGHLAREIVRGGEGATKLVTLHVRGAASKSDAQLAARTIANSPLVKTAIHGADPNWGRLVAAAGRSGAAFRLDRAGVSIGDVDIFVCGVPHDDLAPQAAECLRHAEITIGVDLGTGGRGEATMWTCDFSAEYVRINAGYRT